MKKYFSLGLLAMFFQVLYAQLDPATSSDWTKVGYARENAIPRTFDYVVNVKEIFGLHGDNSTDDTALLQQAINNKNWMYRDKSVVFFFPAGTYILGSSIAIPANASKLVFIGEGSSSTIFKATHNGTVFMTASSTQPGLTPVPSGNYVQYNRGSNEITVPAGGIQQNDFLEIQIKDGSWHGNYHPDNTYIVQDYYVGQIVEVASVVSSGANETAVTLKDELRLNYGWEDGVSSGNLEPKVQKVTTVNNIGFENFKIINDGVTGGSAGYNFLFNYAVNCWMWGVQSEKPYRAHVNISRSSGIEIRGCYFHDAKEFGGNGEGYGITINTHSTNCLIEDNVFDYLRHAMMVQGGANGNVFGYNFSGSQPDAGLMDGDIDNGDISFHGTYPYENLFEGNMALFADADRFWGSNGPYNVLFRNQLRRTPGNICFNLYSTTWYLENNGGIRIIGPYVGGVWQPQVFYVFGNTIRYAFCGETAKNVDALYFTTNEAPQNSNNVRIGSEGGEAGYSMYYTAKPSFLTASYTWPPVGAKRAGASLTQSIPARNRYYNETIKTVASTAYTAESVTPITVNVEQRRESATLMTGSTVDRWENDNTFHNYVVPISPFSLLTGSYQTFRGQQTIVNSPDEKYNQWKVDEIGNNDVKNHHTFTIQSTNSKFTSQFKTTHNATLQAQLIEGGSPGGSVNFQDPWLIDYPDANFGNNLRNQGMSASFKSIAYTQNNIGTGTAYKGVFLNQDQTFDPNVPNYSLTAPATQTINGLTSYFQNWSGSGVTFQNANAQQTGVVFNAAGATVTANYKAVHASNQLDAYDNPGQCKAIRTPPNPIYWPNGLLHIVYESGGNIWYETSSNNGATWSIQKLNDSYPAKNPSMTKLTGNYVAIVFEEQHGWAEKIRLMLFEGTMETGRSYVKFNNGFDIPIEYYTNIEPVIAINTVSGKFIVVWKQEDIPGYPIGGLYYALGKCDTETWSGSEIIWTSSESSYLPISGTNSSSFHPTINSFASSSADLFALAWEQRTGTTNSHIYYRRMKWNTDNVTFDPAQNISSASGYTYNESPSFITYPDLSSRVVWLGRRTGSQEELAKSSAVTEQRVTVFKAPDYYRYWTFGQNVASPHINKSSDRYIAAWSENNGATNKYADNRTLSTIYTLNTTGQNLQVSNGETASNMYVVSFQTQGTPPYRFFTSNSIGSLGKTEESSIANGREGVIAKEGTQVYFALGDITVDAEPIKFKTIEDSVEFTSLSLVNKYLVTEPFKVTSSSQFYFGIECGIADSTGSTTTFSDNTQVRFKVELLDAETQNVIGAFDDVKFTAASLLPYKNIAYSVDTRDIQRAAVQLRLTVEAPADVEFSIKDKIADGSVLGLGKGGARRTVVSHRGTLAITNYELSQNYPNPFNPTTTISYALPQDGMVTLKIYDALGREVKTLVNEFKQTGRYTAEFDASKLSSGVYIYKLVSNKYSAVRKMLLVK